MTPYISDKKKPILLLTIAMTFLCGIAIDIYTPSLPSLSIFLHTSASLVKLSVTIFLFSYGIGYLVIGTLSDYLGRSKILILCMILFILSCLMQTLAGNIWFFLVLRLVQGFVIAAPDVLGKAILADVYQDGSLEKIIPYISTSWALGPIIAPAMGGYLQHYLGWRGAFFFMAIYGMTLLYFIINALPETNSVSRHKKTKLSIGHIYLNYRKIFFSGIFMGSALCRLCGYSIVILFSIVGPFFMQNILHYTPIKYGHIAFIIGLFAFLGTLGNQLLLSVFSSIFVVLLGSCAMLFFSIALLAISFTGHTDMALYIVAISAIFFARGLVSSNCLSEVLDCFSGLRGAVSSLSGFVLIFSTAIITSGASFLQSTSLMPLGVVYCILTIGIVASYLFLLRPGYLKYKTSQAANNLYTHDVAKCEL